MNKYINNLMYFYLSADTLFEVCELENLTKYHVRVASMNKGGNSNWLDLDEPASTTAKAVKLMATMLALTAACGILIY